jgi:hypothetical protein
MSWGHNPTLAAQRRSHGEELLNQSTDRLQGHSEYHISVAEYPLSLSNKLLWLGNNDTDWHSPLFVRVRCLAERNKRKRSEEGYAKRLGKGKGKGKNKGKEGEHAQAGKGKGSKTTTAPAAKGKGKGKTSTAAARPKPPPELPEQYWDRTAGSASSSSAPAWRWQERQDWSQSSSWQGNWSGGQWEQR